MFGFDWSEIALVAVVALILIGPKDMPVAIKAISDTIKRMRRMAGEFQHHVDDMLRDANLSDVKDSIDELRGLNVKSAVRRTLDPDGVVSKAFADPFVKNPVPPVMRPTEIEIPTRPAMTEARPAPAFIPPNTPPPAAIQPPPAFIPPEILGS